MNKIRPDERKNERKKAAAVAAALNVLKAHIHFTNTNATENTRGHWRQNIL